VRLSDVARWTAGVENVRTASWMNHQSAVIIDVQRQPGANVIATVDAIKAALPALSADARRHQGDVLTDRTAASAPAWRMQFELVLAVLLVVLVIFLFLGPRATLVAAISVPLSLVGAFAAMWALGFRSTTSR
jgi:multidrug efflux pump